MGKWEYENKLHFRVLKWCQMILAAILVIMKRFVLIINGLGMIKKGKKEEDSNQ